VAPGVLPPPPPPPGGAKFFFPFTKKKFKKKGGGGGGTTCFVLRNQDGLIFLTSPYVYGVWSPMYYEE